MPLLILVIGLVAVLSGFFALRYLETRMIGTAGEGLALAASELADKLDWILFERYGDIQVLAKTAESWLHNRRALTAHLIAVQQIYPLYRWIAVADASGTIVAATAQASVGLDRHEQRWFQALRDGAPVYTGDVDFSRDDDHGRVVSIAGSIVDAQGRFQGAVIAHVGLAVLEDAAVRTVRAYQARAGFYSRIEYQILKGTGEVFVDSLSPAEGANLKALGLPSAGLLASGTPGYIVERHLRRMVPVVTGYARTEGYGRHPGLGWGVLVRLDQRDILSPIRKVQRVLGGVAALVLLPVLGFLFWSSVLLRREEARGRAHRARAQDAERRYRNIVEHSTNLFYSHTTDHVLTYLSPQVRDVLGYEPEEALVKWTTFLTGNPANAKGVELTQRAIETGQAPPPYEMELRRKDGRAIWVEVREAPVVRDGRVVAIVGSLTDITERKQAEEALRRNEARQSLILRTVPIVLYTAQPYGDYGATWISENVQDITGFPPERFVGDAGFWVSRLHPDDRDAALAAARTAVEAGMGSAEYRWQCADGRYRWVFDRSAAVRDVSGRPQELIGIWLDITDRKCLEASARRMEHLALLGQLMGGIAHEIKNPLFVQTGYLQIAREDLAKGNVEALQTDLEHIDEAARRITQTIQRFLTLARPTPPAIGACLVQDVLRETLAFLQHECLMNQVTVEAAIAPDLPPIESNARLLQETFLNLMVNAIQAMHEAHGKGTLTVSAKPSAVSDQPSASESRWIEVRIQDDGPGIPPEHRARLFEPFFSTKPAGIGTGLGLWTVRTNLASLGGTVRFETAMGKGATFIVRLPVAPRQESPVVSAS